MSMATPQQSRNMKKGLAPKGHFFQALIEHFKRPVNLRRLLTVFTGAACEQWINCEAFMALRGYCPNAWIYPEWGKRDVAIFASESDERPSLLMETKVLYANYPLSKQRQKLDALANQLEQCRDLVGVDAPKNAVVGLVVGFDWTVTSSQLRERPRPNVPKRERLPRKLFEECGLENAFGHTGGRVLKGRVRSHKGTIAVEVHFEVVRLAGARAKLRS